MVLARLLPVALGLSVLAGCGSPLAEALFGPRCLDDVLDEIGENRDAIEAEAASLGIDAATLVESIVTGAGILDDVIDCEASFALGNLADKTGGDNQEAKSGDDAAGTLVDQVDQQPAGSDVVFLLDASCSMQDDLDAVRARIDELLDQAGDGARAGLVLYRDQNVDGSSWYERKSDLVRTSDAGLRSSLDAVTASGGGDIPESLYDAVTRVLETQEWTSDDRSIMVLTDAGPLEGELTTATEDSTAELARELGVEISIVQVTLW